MRACEGAEWGLGPRERPSRGPGQSPVEDDGESAMRASRVLCASVAAIGVLAAQSVWAQQESAQSLQAQIDELKKDFDAMKQQYGDRLTALETKLAGLPAQPEQPAVAVATPAPNN